MEMALYGSIWRIRASDSQITSLMAQPPCTAIESTNHQSCNQFKRLDPPRGAEMTGMCSDIRLIDIRVVLNDPGRAALSREFNVIAALFVRYLNSVRW